MSATEAQVAAAQSADVLHRVDWRLTKPEGWFCACGESFGRAQGYAAAMAHRPQAIADAVVAAGPDQ